MTRLLLFLLLLPSLANAATYYVRNDGGTDVQCTGKTDAAYDGSGSGEACAYSHPYYWKPVYGTTTTSGWAGGDTLIIDGTDHVGVLDQVVYTMGYGGPKTGHAECNNSFPADCEWEMPSGTSGTHTKIVGKGYDTRTGPKPILKGGRSIYRGVIDLYGADYVDIRYLEITDNDDCARANNPGAQADPACVGEYANYGIWSDTTRHNLGGGSDTVLVEDVDMHGLGQGCVFFSGASNWSFIDSSCRGVGLVGMNNDNSSASDGLSGTFYVTNFTMEYIGCAEDKTTGAIIDDSCMGQGGSYWNANGDGWGFSSNGTGAIGNWEIDNLTCRFTMQDCFDGLHGDGTGYVKIKNSRFYSINGASVKAVNPATVENSVIIDNCTWPYEFDLYVKDGVHDTDMIFCRADAAISLQSADNRTHTFIGNTIFGNHDQMFSIFGSDGCDNGKVYLRNNIVYGGANAINDTTHPYGGFTGTGGGNTDAYYTYSSGGSGCAGVAIDEDYNTFYNTKDGAADVHGSHSYYRDPGLTATIKTGPTSGAGYYSTDPLADFSLAVGSNLRYEVGGANTADETVTCWGDCSVDNNNSLRGANWDTGYLEYGTIATCNNGTQDGDEIGVDCGGSCGACSGGGSGGGTTTTGSKGIRGYSILRGKSIYR